MKIRVATRAVGKGGGKVETMDDVHGGLKIPWVELDGVKYDDVINATIEVQRGSMLRTQITFEFIGPIEIVYVDKDGVEIGSVSTYPGSIPQTLDCNTYIEVPPEIEPGVIEASKESDRYILTGGGELKPGWLE